MITSQAQTFLPRHAKSGNPAINRILLAAFCMVSFSICGANLGADSPHRFESQRIDLSGIVPARSPRKTGKSKAISASKQANQPESAKKVGREPIEEVVQQAGFYDVAYGGCSGGCGLVCDCGEAACGVEGPVCGVESACCGAGYGIAGCCGPGCGLEACGPLGCGGPLGCDAGLGCDSGCCDSAGCDSCYGSGSGLFFKVPVLHVVWNRLELFGGVNGFKGPLNYTNTTNNGNLTGDAGSFGFYEGFNEGRSLKWFYNWDMAWQWGVRATQSNMSGTTFSGETRHQVFLTSGMFRRVDYGLQYGVVVDRLYGDWYYRANLTQLRTELSWKFQGPQVLGFRFMAGSGSDDSTTTVRDESGNVFNENISFEPTDQYRIFYRQLFGSFGYWEAFGGWTDNDDALVGMSLDMPVGRRLAFNTGATYLNASENDAILGPQNEGWNISVGFSYRPSGFNRSRRHSRPMFNVADNGTFMIDRL